LAHPAGSAFSDAGHNPTHPASRTVVDNPVTGAGIVFNINDDFSDVQQWFDRVALLK